MSEPAISSGKDSTVRSKSDLPPPRQRKGVRSVSPPLSNVSFHRFNYYIAIFAVLLFALYTYRLLQWKAAAGSWWNLALGKKPSVPQGTSDSTQGGNSWQAGSGIGSNRGGELSVEERINDLAAALGMPSKDLASAIADAVRAYVPPASLSSVSAHQTGEAVSYLVDPSAASQSETGSAAAETVVTQGFGAVSSMIEAAVGMEEPPSELS